MTYELQQHIMELEESDKLLKDEQAKAAEKVERIRKKCNAAKKAIDDAGKRRMAEFEAYALGKKKKYDASGEEMEGLRKKHEALLEELSEAENEARKLSRMKVHECFPVMRLTKELLDEYVESVEVHPGNEVKIEWK